MSFVKVSEGYVVEKSQFFDGCEAACMSRMAYNHKGELLCSHVENGDLGRNNFIVIISKSNDHGRTFERLGPAFPHLIGKKSIGGCLSAGSDGRMYLYGSIFNIDSPDEKMWEAKTRGLKQNNIFYAYSVDGGYSWTDPIIIPFAFSCASEAACGMQVTSDGSYISCYAPHYSMQNFNVDIEQIMFIKSTDKGKSWNYNTMLRFDSGDIGAEAWVVEMKSGVYCGASWRQRFDRGFDYENAMSFSIDKGKTWTSAQGLGFKGQSIALSPMDNGNVAMVYNQRFHDTPGVWIAEIGFDGQKAIVLSNQIGWSAENATIEGTSNAEKAVWTNFAFGEPHVVPLTDGDYLLSMWCKQPGFTGIRTVRLRYC